MKKFILPLLILMLITGCSKIDNNTKEYKDIVNNVLSYNNTSVNTASYGYEYYIPIGVNLTYNGELNKEFKVKNTKFVLYVDIVSYYYKNNLNFNQNDMNYKYYFSKIDNGYISVDKISEEEYFLKIVYNYAKIESYVKEENLIDIINYSTIILNSIKYNDTLISNVIEKGAFFGNEIVYEIDKPDDSESKFYQYLQEYVQQNDKEEQTQDVFLPDE